MPLHLLGKKSWHVYNGANIERVRRDEAEARAREEAEERRMQEEDARRRTAVLRGELPPPLPPSVAPDGEDDGVGRRPGDGERAARWDDGAPRKRRRLRGEDDTDRDIRYAREDAEAGEKATRRLVRREDRDVPLHDEAGHLQLVPAPDAEELRRAEKNAEVEAEKARKRQREEDRYTMRFSNAAGYGSGMAKPWYAAAGADVTTREGEGVRVLSDVQDRDVWGNEDGRRKEREHARISSNDPFAAMQQAQRQLKVSERDRARWKAERAAQMEELKHAEEQRRRRERKKVERDRDDDEVSLEGFGLDDSRRERSEDRDGRDRKHRRHHHRHHHGRRRPSSRSRSPERRGQHRSHSSRDR